MCSFIHVLLLETQGQACTNGKAWYPFGTYDDLALYCRWLNASRAPFSPYRTRVLEGSIYECTTLDVMALPTPAACPNTIWWLCCWFPFIKPIKDRYPQKKVSSFILHICLLRFDFDLCLFLFKKATHNRRTWDVLGCRITLSPTFLFLVTGKCKGKIWGGGHFVCVCILLGWF